MYTCYTRTSNNHQSGATKCVLVVGGANMQMNLRIIISCHTDVRLTGHVIQTGEKKQIILNCSVTGIHNTSNVVEIRFNDDKLYSCRKMEWPNEPEGSIDKPHTHLLDNDTTCQLTIPTAAKADIKHYHCRVKLELSPETVERTCYLMSETIIPSEETLPLDVDTSENNSITTVIGIAVLTAIVITIAISVMVSLVVAKTRKDCHQHQHIACQAQNQCLLIQNGHYVPPQAIHGNFRNRIFFCSYTLNLHVRTYVLYRERP